MTVGDIKEKLRSGSDTQRQGQDSCSRHSRKRGRRYRLLLWWVQNLQSLSWSLEEVNNKLADILLKAFDEVYGLTEERGYPMRTSAYIIALRRLVKTKKIRAFSRKLYNNKYEPCRKMRLFSF